MAGKEQNRILFLSVPESLRGQIESMDSGFSINPDIPIPVEIPDGKEKLNLEELSWEMIISGMLGVIAAGTESPEHLGYYRRFVLAVKPNIMGEFTEAAILKARNGDFVLALEIFDALLGLFPNSPAALLNRAVTLEEQAKHFERHGKKETEAAFQSAEAAYTQAAALEPPFPDALFNAGFFHLGRGNYSRAKECLNNFLENANDDEKREQAESVVREITASGFEDECFTEAYNLLRQGEEEAAMHTIRDFIERRPEVWNGWFVLGWALRRLGRWEDGAAAFSRAVELGGGNSDTRNEFAICLMEMGDYRAARRELEAALREDGENVKIISNLGVLALKSGDDDEAAAFFRTVLELDPEDPIASGFFAGRGIENANS